MVGRLLGGVVGGKGSSRVQTSFLASLGIALLLATMFSPVKMITLFGYQFPLSMAFMVGLGLCTWVMWGGIFNMAAEGLGKYVPMGSGIFMAMVFGGILIPVQGFLADKIGIDSGIVDAVINKKLITAGRIFRFTLSDKARFVRYMAGTNTEVVEYVVAPGAAITKAPLKDLKFPANAIIGGVIRSSESFIAVGDTQIEPYDRVAIFALPESIKEIDKFFK